MTKFRLIAFINIILLTAVYSFAQQNGTLTGQVTDTLGALVVGANVTVIDGTNKQKTAVTNRQGEFTVGGLAPGKYTVRVSMPKFSLYENTEVEITAGAKTELVVPLTVAAATEQVDIDASTQLSSDPNDNKDSTVLKGKDLESLPEDPDELEAALRAMAGGAGGPDGAQITIDGVAGRMPPRDSIREIRINQNPFSAEFDRLGFGRIEILTRPGSDKFRGGVNFNFNDESLNARNPFSTNRAPSQVKSFGGNLSGPIKKGKSSFFFDMDYNRIENGNAVRATVIDPTTLAIVPFAQEFTIPNRRFSVGPRIDYQINQSNTLVTRYNYSQGSTQNSGIGGFSLPSRAFDSKNSSHQITLTETAILNPKTVNETRFQYGFNRNESTGDNSIPTINVSSSFIGGGAQIGQNFNKSHRWELQNYTTTSLGKNSEHAIKFGVRLKGVSITDRSASNYGGTFTFTGIPFCLDEEGKPCLNPNGTQVSQDIVLVNGTVLQRPLFSIDQYQEKLKGNLDPRFNPNQYSIQSGNPLATVSQYDYGFFVLDDWRARRNLTLSFGLRYENQNNISDNFNFAPRFGFAWTIGGGGANPPSVIIRGGAGLFYDRLGENFTLQANRFDGIQQKNYIVTNIPAILGLPVFTATGVSNVPTAAQLGVVAPQTNLIRTVDPGLQSPYTIQTALSAERQLIRNTTLTVSYVWSRNDHLLRTRNINAPICPPLAGCPIGSPRPFPTLGNIYETESSARSDFQMLFFSLNSRLNTRVSLNASYFLSLSKGDSNGEGRFGGGSFPAYSYDLSGEYAKTAQDQRHRFVMVGSFTLPWRFNLNPFVIISSGTPFNIVSGSDTNRDSQFTERPTYAQLNTKCDELGLTNSFCDISGIADPANTIIPRNYGRGPGSVSFNMSLSKTFGFGKAIETGGQANRGNGGQGGGNRGGGGDSNRGGGGGRGPGSGGGGPAIMGGGGPGMMVVQMGGGGGAPRPYNLTFSINANNLFNINNKGNPVGALNSNSFGQSIGGGGAFGFFGGGGGGFGGGGGGGARQIRLSARFNW